jgi:hypothetical protein
MGRRAWISIFLVACAVGAEVGPAQAEVRAVTRRDGTYVSVSVTRSGWGGVWEPLRRADAGGALNPNGDRIRDLWPSVLENSLAPHHPWAVWSRLDKNDYQLAWSRWSNGRWDPVRWLDAQPAPGADLDPVMAFDGAGRPFVVWWRDLGGRGSVFISLFLETSWLPPFQVSDPANDAKYPRLRIESDGELLVNYMTQEGLVEQLVLFDDPGTVTDDITPMGCVFHAGTAVLVQRYDH